MADGISKTSSHLECASTMMRYILFSNSAPKSIVIWPMAELAMTTDEEVLVAESDDSINSPGNVVHLFQCAGLFLATNQATC